MEHQVDLPTDEFAKKLVDAAPDHATDVQGQAPGVSKLLRTCLCNAVDDQTLCNSTLLYSCMVAKSPRQPRHAQLL